MQEAGRYEDSLEPLRALIEEDSNDPELHFLYGVALRRTGESGLAVWSLEMASRAPEFELSGNLELAAAALGNHSFPTAIRATTRVLEIEPDHVPALSMRGAAYLGDRTEPELALADFDRLLEIDPENDNARVQRASVLLVLERVEEAQEAIAELQAIGGDESGAAISAAHICVAAATFALERGEVEETRALFEQCLERDPTAWIVISEAVPFFDAQDDRERGDEILRSALADKPAAGAYRSALADRLVARGAVAEAESLLKAGTELDSPSAASQSWGALATFYLTRTDYPAAADAYERALAFDPEPSQEQLLDFADLLSLAGRHERALEVAEDFEQSIFRDLIRARVFLNRDEPADALERLDAALVLWPNNVAARYYAALAAERVGQFDRAIEEYRQAIRVGADHTDAPLRLARLLVADGSFKASLVAISHRLKTHPKDQEAILLGLHAAEELNDRGQIKNYLALSKGKGAKGSGNLWPRALEVSTEAVAARQGADATVDALLGDRRIVFTNPTYAPVLRALLRQMDAAGRLDEAVPLIESATTAHPTAAAFQSARGLMLAAQGAQADVVRAAFQSALDLDPLDATALLGLAKIEQRSGHIDAALELYDRAAAADATNPATVRAGALLLAEANRGAEAEPRLEELLRERPYDAAVALALARIRIARGAESERSLELAQRAMRFGAGDEARELIATLQSSRGDAARPRS